MTYNDNFSEIIGRYKFERNESRKNDDDLIIKKISLFKQPQRNNPICLSKRGD